MKSRKNKKNHIIYPENIRKQAWDGIPDLYNLKLLLILSNSGALRFFTLFLKSKLLCPLLISLLRVF